MGTHLVVEKDMETVLPNEGKIISLVDPGK